MFGSAHYQKTFLIRFVAYFGMIVGFLTLVLGVEPVLGEELKYQTDQILGVKHLLPRIVTSTGSSESGLSGSVDQNDADNSGSGFGSVLSNTPTTITPVSTDFGIVIEKINANAKVVPNVDPSNQTEYTNALSQGVAHAKGTSLPGEAGNSYLFSHSTDAPWNIIRYNAIFYLLGKLEKDDRVIIFYQGRRYDYIVFDKAIVAASDTHFLTDKYNQAVLTLQTCDPPGTTINRLIIRAKLAGS